MKVSPQAKNVNRRYQTHGEQGWSGDEQSNHIKGFLTSFTDKKYYLEANQ